MRLSGLENLNVSTQAREDHDAALRRHEEQRVNIMCNPLQTTGYTCGEVLSLYNAWSHWVLVIGLLGRTPTCVCVLGGLSVTSVSQEKPTFPEWSGRAFCYLLLSKIGSLT